MQLSTVYVELRTPPSGHSDGADGHFPFAGIVVPSGHKHIPFDGRLLPSGHLPGTCGHTPFDGILVPSGHKHIPFDGRALPSGHGVGGGGGGGGGGLVTPGPVGRFCVCRFPTPAPPNPGMLGIDTIRAVGAAPGAVVPPVRPPVIAGAAAYANPDTPINPMANNSNLLFCIYFPLYSLRNYIIKRKTVKGISNKYCVCLTSHSFD